MKIYIKIGVELLILILFLSDCSKKEFNKCCNCLEDNGISDEYVFPIQPGTEEWANFKSHQEMVNACQIPDNILHEICTYGLVDTYLNYPLLFTIFAFNNINEGLDQVCSDFNGFREFLTREDCVSELLEEYENIDPSSLDSSWTALERGLFKQSIQFMELTLGYGPMRQRFKSDEINHLIIIALEKLRIKEENDYSRWSCITNLYVISTTLLDANYKPFTDFITARSDLQLFINGNLNELVYIDDSELIKTYANSFIEQFN